MKICYDNLEKLEYMGNSLWRNLNNKTWVSIIDSCKVCGEEFLANMKNKNTPRNTKFCSRSCQMSFLNSGEKNSNWKGGIYKNNKPLFKHYEKRLKENNIEYINNNDLVNLKCEICNEYFLPTTRHLLAILTSLKGNYNHGIYCSEECKQACSIYNQKLWPKGFKINTSREVQPELRQMVLKRDNYTCLKCEKHQNELNVSLHCHHVEGIRWEPIESADMDKCLTYCKDCHNKVHQIEGCTYNDYKCPDKYNIYNNYKEI